MLNTAIIVPNVNEVIRRGMPWSTFSKNFLNKLFIAGAAYSEMGLFWDSHCTQRIIITPVNIPEVYIDYIHSVMKYDSLRQIVSNYRSGVLSEWNSTLKEVSNEVNVISFYGASKEAYSFCKLISKHAKGVIKNDLPLDVNYRVAILYDSKSNFRKNIDQYSNLTLPHIVTNSSHIKTELYKYYKKNVPCMVKAEFGVGGYGNIQFKQFDQGYEFWLKSINNGFEFAPYLPSGDIIIEELITSKKRNCFSGFGYISEDYSYTNVGSVEEIRNSLGYYIGSTNLTSEYVNMVENATLSIGLLLSEKQYRGYFCVDFIQNSNNQIHILEINTRRCASSYIFDIIKRLQFDNNIAWYHRLSIPVKLAKEDHLINRVIEIFDTFNRDSNRYALPIQVSGLLQEDPYMGIILFGEDNIIIKNYLNTLLSKLYSIGIFVDV
jgi:hypothetical protein